MELARSTMEIKKIPLSILQSFYNRGLTKEFIENSTPEELFKEYCMDNDLDHLADTLLFVIKSLKKANT